MRKSSPVLGGKGSWNLGLIAEVSPFGQVQASEMWRPVKRLEALVREKWPLGTLDGAPRPLMTAPWVLIYEAVVRGTQRATNHTGYEILVQYFHCEQLPKVPAKFTGDSSTSNTRHNLNLDDFIVPWKWGEGARKGKTRKKDRWAAEKLKPLLSQTIKIPMVGGLRSYGFHARHSRSW